MNSWSGPRFPVGENHTEAHPLETVALWGLGGVVSIGVAHMGHGPALRTALQRVMAPGSRLGDGVSHGQPSAAPWRPRGSMACARKHADTGPARVLRDIHGSRLAGYRNRRSVGHAPSETRDWSKNRSLGAQLATFALSSFAVANRAV